MADMEIIRKVKVENMENMTLNSAVKFLEALGFKARRTKLYDAAKAGKIKLNPDYTVTPAALMSYAFIEKVPRPADACLARSKVSQSSAKEKLRLRKLEAETLFAEDQAEREKMKRLIEEGRLLSSEELYLDTHEKVTELIKTLSKKIERLERKVDMHFS